ncbi:hypothetical protein, partial [Burkholderia sp. BCC1970]|uniref:hypothetical protein n=1 Tax=Burkholderia sp. BCC1970 TaxID=2817437 RepID=UPI002ABD6F27
AKCLNMSRKIKPASSTSRPSDALAGNPCHHGSDGATHTIRIDMHASDVDNPPNCDGTSDKDDGIDTVRGRREPSLADRL